MNRVYKIVWSKAKNAYVVTSELAKNHTKNASGKMVKAALTAAVGMGVLMGGYVADAAAKDIVDKGGNPIAYDISPENDGTNIAIGKNAKVFIGGGTQESMLSFGETVDPTYKYVFGIPFQTGWNIHSNTDAKKNLPAGMAVGKNTYARTGSIQIGDHTLEKNQIAIGDTTADKLRQFGVASTTLGTNSYTGGGFATTIGSYNVQSSQYEAANSSDTLSNSTKNAFSTVVGTLNSNESMTGFSSSGVSNMISGVANKVTNSNGAIVMGAGNSIKNSSAAFDTSAYSTPYNSVATMQKALMDGVARSAGGSTLAIGGANAAEYTQASQLIGVGNTLTGKSGNVSKYNMLDGYKNKASNVQHVSVIGSENNVTNTNGAVVFGDKRTLTGADGSIVIGSSANGTATSVKNAIAIGSETNVTVAGGVALGSGSVASVDKGAVGYDASGTNHNSDTTGVWKSTAAAVSVGDAAGNTKVTRQITNVAAGTADTDAVNVAQLKKVAAKAAEEAAKHTTVTAGDYVTVTETETNGQKNYTVSGPKMESTDGSVRITDKVENGKKVGYNLSVDTSSLGIEKTKVEAGDNVTVTSKKTGNTTTYTVNAKDTVVTGGTATYALNGTGSATLINNDGTTATITGLQDRYTSSASLSGDTLNFTRNDGSTYSVSGIASSQDIKNVTNKVGELGIRVNRVGAGAAALAALHPLDFDPDDKWDVAAGYGNYKDAHAVSVGAFYRPNEDTMFSVGGAFGGGENMVNAGVSVKLGQGNHVSTSKVAMAKEIVDLKDAVTRLEAQNEQFRQIIGQMAGQPVRNVEFPDVPKDHWAYSYVKSLADRGLLEGYPDGEFKGDRSMTRYEFAAIIYRALQNGAPVDGNMGKAMEEFGPEIEKVREAYRFRVDRISGGDNDRNKVERVRVNNEGNKEKGDYRDIYGSHIAAGK
ncbi:ESPR-type extended signal peptide-containing protein [Dialister invisus]|uniref:ESPR-type extended signal peptide-containing protein n=1 Tax=Dialister invisus TaxID=218538 RepID=UPI002671FDF1|nr:ESPR-type extended signal peptide-containing protein [Dialister invisus]